MTYESWAGRCFANARSEDVIASSLSSVVAEVGRRFAGSAWCGECGQVSHWAGCSRGEGAVL